MIKYLLKCNRCSNEFDSWFSVSSEYNRLKKLKLLNCNACGSEKVDCEISISKDFMFINKTKINKEQVINIKNKLICKNEFGFSKCLPSNINDIAFKKITLIFYQNEILQAKLIFIKDLVMANEFSNNLKKWLGWDSL